MKSNIIIAAVAVALTAPLAAQAQSAYAGANIGRAEQKINVDTGFGNASEKENTTGFKLYGGYDFTPNVGIEGGYVDFRKVEKSALGYGISSKPHALYVAATGTLPLNEQFSLFGKLGIARSHTSFDAWGPGFTDSASDNQTTPVIGVGASFALDKKISFVAEYENFGKVAKDGSDNVKADLLSVGVRFKF